MKLHEKSYAIPFNLVIKIIGVLNENSMEKWKWNILCIWSMSLLSMTLFCCSCWVSNILTQWLVLPGLGDPYFPLIWLFNFFIMTFSPMLSQMLCHTSKSCHQCSREVLSAVIYLYIVWPIVIVLDLIHFIPLYSLFHIDDGGLIMALLQQLTSYWIQLII